MSRVFVEYSLSHSAEYFRRSESLSASLNSGTEKVCIIERGESIKVSVEKNLSHSAENFRRGTLLCCASELFQERKLLWIKRGNIKNFRR